MGCISLWWMCLVFVFTLSFLRVPFPPMWHVTPIVLHPRHCPLTPLSPPLVPFSFSLHPPVLSVPWGWPLPSLSRLLHTAPSVTRCPVTLWTWEELWTLPVALLSLLLCCHLPTVTLPLPFSKTVVCHQDDLDSCLSGFPGSWWFHSSLFSCERAVPVYSSHVSRLGLDLYAEVMDEQPMAPNILYRAQQK